MKNSDLSAQWRNAGYSSNDNQEGMNNWKDLNSRSHAGGMLIGQGDKRSTSYMKTMIISNISLRL